MDIIIGTRASALAKRQTELVADLLRAAWPGLGVIVREFTTAGDRDLTSPLPQIGGKGLFTAELAAALRSGEIHMAVHSLKDLPIEMPGCGDGEPPLCIAAVLPREDARDALVSRHGVVLTHLPPRPRIGTSSPRRAAQLLAARPDAQIVPLRGNLDTRLRKAMSEEYDAIVVAVAGLARMGLADRITQYLSFDLMLPAPGQGALAVQCRADDRLARDLLAPIHDPATWAATVAERTFLIALGGGCCAPVAAYGECTPDSFMLQLRGLVASPDGAQMVRVADWGSALAPEALGAQLAVQALAQGGAALMAACEE
ncbi:MAG: hydroxymethylbilane synthase [Anaerolineae bacterium]